MGLKEGSLEGKGHGWQTDQIAKSLANINLEGSEDDVWEQVTREAKNRALGSTESEWPTNDCSDSWITTRPISSTKTKAENEEVKELVSDHVESLKDDGDEDDAYSDGEAELLSDDSDESPKTHEDRKNHKMLKRFFKVLDRLSVEAINAPGRRWHCPACQGGPFSIQWYRGIQRLRAHAKTKCSVRWMLHREFSELLEEEMQRRGIVPSVESCGNWEELKQETRDFNIVWPPMVVVMNTSLDKDKNEKGIAMGDQELLDYFSSYHAVKSQHSNYPQEHQVMSVLIFESSAVGYLEAERLHKHFLDKGTGRYAWDNPDKQLYCSEGKRKFYGFLAVKEDLDMLNQHCQGKSGLMFEMKSYKEMVVSQLKKLSDNNQQLNREEEVELEKAFDSALTKPMEKFNLGEKELVSTDI